jgi:hypothetical protein
MNYRVTIGFLAAAVILGALVVGLDRFNVGPTASNIANATATTSAIGQPPIFQFDDTKVTAFEMQQEEKTVRVERQAEIWIVAGTGEPANRTSFSSLVARMSQLKSTRLLESPGDLSQYGLDPPKESARALLDDGTSYQLDIGIKTPVQSGTYARRPDAPNVYTIADGFANDLERLIGDPKEPPTPTPRPATPTPETSPIPEGTPTATP